MICKAQAIDHFSQDGKRIPAHPGFALRDALDAGQAHSCWDLGKAVSAVAGSHDPLIVTADELAQDAIPVPRDNGHRISVAS